jgi:hypothetical protein
MTPHHLTPWLSTFAHSNIYAQAKMMSSLIDQECARLKAIKSSCDARTVFLEGASARLDKDLATLEEVARHANTSVTGYSKRKEEVVAKEVVKAELRNKQPLLNQLFLMRKQPPPAAQ